MVGIFIDLGGLVEGVAVLVAQVLAGLVGFGLAFQVLGVLVGRFGEPPRARPQRTRAIFRT